MARILSPVWSIIRGSIAGTTYFANQFHQIVARARTAPVQPNTNPQTLIRASMNNASAIWNGLTDGVQFGWQVYANLTPFSGPLGSYTVPGRQMFMAGRVLQDYIINSGFALPTFDVNPPAPMAGFLNLRNVIPTAPVSVGTGIGLSVTADALDDSMTMLEINGPFTSSRKRFKGPWDTSKTIAVVLPVNTTVVLEIMGLLDGGIYFTRLKGVADDAPPRVSTRFINRHIAQVITP